MDTNFCCDFHKINFTKKYCYHYKRFMEVNSYKIILYSAKIFVTFTIYFLQCVAALEELMYIISSNSNHAPTVSSTCGLRRRLQAFDTAVTLFMFQSIFAITAPVSLLLQGAGCENNDTKIYHTIQWKRHKADDSNGKGAESDQRVCS
jgi:hypothetical protein